MNKPFSIVFWMLLLLLCACKRDKDELVPFTSFEVTTSPHGIVVFTPTDAKNTQTWDFGDGSPTYSATAGLPVSHYYASNGSYTTKLVVQSPEGGRTEFSLPVSVSNVPQRGFITGLQINTLNDLTTDPDSSGSDLLMTIKRYAENSTDLLYRSTVYSNFDDGSLPLVESLAGSSRVEFPLTGYLISISLEDDNTGTITPNDVLCYTAWYDGTLRPTRGASWQSIDDKPDFYPDSISRRQNGNTMLVTFEWE